MRYRATLVPDRVISSQQGLKYVFVVKPDNTLERRNLETGGLFEGKRIVKSGLKDGEKVVSTRLQLLQAGMKVTPVPEETPASGTETKKSIAKSQNEKLRRRRNGCRHEFPALFHRPPNLRQRHQYYHPPDLCHSAFNPPLPSLSPYHTTH